MECQTNWMEFITIITGILGILAIMVTLFIQLGNKIDAVGQDVKNLRGEVAKDFKDLRGEIYLEMRDFHGRLCSLEERYRNPKTDP